ncbi:hypothetical protein BBP40_007976 [Aspergillus hancockii]|nr:hypothetical protein BBP40_007976 [Aspergillus hancockii]
MSQTIEASRQQWDPLATCEITHPSRHGTCIGVAKNGGPCRNKVSKESRETASHRLEILALCPIDESLVSKLQEIANLLLCKRRHQDQATSVTRAERSVFENSTSLPTTRQQSQEVTDAMVQENQIPFHVSSTRPAVVTVPTASGHTGSVVFRSFRKGRDISDVECGICRERHSDDTVYLNCEECAGEFHWRCMQGWLTHRSPRSNFSCPNWTAFSMDFTSHTVWHPYVRLKNPPWLLHCRPLLVRNQGLGYLSKARLNLTCRQDRMVRRQRKVFAVPHGLPGARSTLSHLSPRTGV